MPGPGDNDDFASVLSRAMAPPELATGEGKDLPDGFPLPVAPHHRVVDSTNDPTAIEGVTVYDFAVKRGVFLIYRPWSSCDRCRTDIGTNNVVLPSDGDHTCPHTQLAAYEAVVNKTLAGEYLAGKETEVVQKDGSIVISFKWFEKKLNPARLKAAQRRARARAAAEGGQQDEPDL